MASLQFVLWKSAGSTSDQHLAIYNQNLLGAERATPSAALVHWVLPQQHQRRLGKQSHSFLIESVELPLAEQVLDTGQCTLVRGTLPIPNGLERLHMCFEGASLRGHYSLLRLQAHSTRWLFGLVQYMPNRFARGSFVAPLWPTTQNKLV
ncbi:hypothetical protein [Hymenobacter norwichensis]|uniref:hypothetical protein n=1 Tax=Hymenobacter norwichensis TaxID=223903 RepID=UPI0003B6DB9C|nr:hypothetical protein [Hymenobacter norwichensis]